MALTLFHYWRSSSSWRLRWALALKKLPFEAVAVNLLAAEDKAPAYLAKNPAGYVPCLIVNGKPMAETMAILEWLEETHPTPNLLSGNAMDRALIRALAETVNSGIQPLHNLDVLRKVSPDKEAQGEWVKHWVGKGLAVYEKIITEARPRASKFSLSDEPCLADLFLVPQVFVAHRFGLGMEDFPRCEAIYRHALTTPECAGSRPDAVKPEGAV